MSRAIVGLCTLEIHLYSVDSLKTKRSIIKPLLKRIHTQFHVACAEIAENDSLDNAVIAFVSVSNSAVHQQQIMNTVADWIENNLSDGMITRQTIEIL